MNQSKIVRLSESGIMLAFAVVLSILKLVDLPYGGSITICSMLPIALIAYRYGTRWGLLTAFAFSLIQMLDGMKNLQYATSFGALMAIMLLDYIVAVSYTHLDVYKRQCLPGENGKRYYKS